MMTKFLNKKVLTILLIILLALVLRVWRLDDYPALNADEASIGYNAYSLIQTGKDEHANPWPIDFQSFNDYKPGLYFYIVLPFVKFIGLNAWSVRLPGALLGVTTVYLLYLFVKELKLTKSLKIGNWELGISDISAFFLAISPWHIHFSRGGWEVNTATFFMVLGALLFLKASKNTKYYIFSLLSFAASLYTYQATRVVTPLLGGGMVIIYWKRIRSNLKKLVPPLIITALVLLPLAKDLVSPGVLSRASGVGILADTGPFARINEQRGEHSDYESLIAVALHNKVVNYSLRLMENWTDHFHGEFLFLSGDAIQRDKVPETGEMYLFDILFLAAGFIVIAKKLTRKWAVVLWWLLVAPVGAALTFQSPHALRAQNMVIPLTIISAFGLFEILKWARSNIKSKRLLLIINFSLLSLIAWQFARYLHMYWVHMAKEYPYSSQYGAKEMVNWVSANQENYSKVIVTTRYDQPYILFLFYMKYPPAKFQGEHVLTPRDKYGFSTVDHFDKYYFGSIDFDEIRPNNPNAIIVGTDEEIHKEANIVKIVNFPNGEPAYKIVAN